MKPLYALVALLASLFVHSGVHAEVPPGAVWIDVRSAEEFAGGHLEGALNIPHESIEASISELALATNTPIYLYCRSGRRSGIAKEKLQKMGYSELTNAGGLEDARTLAANHDS